ncbi:MAG: signal peptidase I [Bdellovibrionales bacterium]|nr:signal peptidase I [Bdellovibrionales bacterium]
MLHVPRLFLLLLLSVVWPPAAAYAECQVQAESRIVAGESMLEIFTPGSVVNIQNGWYACHPVLRNDVVIVKFDYRARPIIKMARVLPGDKFRLVPFRDGYHMRVNDEVLKTPMGTPYFFGGKGYKMLALYEESFRGLMPPDTFFVFGTVVGGSLDSSRFGPVKRDQLAGRVQQ